MVACMLGMAKKRVIDHCNSDDYVLLFVSPLFPC